MENDLDKLKPDSEINMEAALIRLDDIDPRKQQILVRGNAIYSAS